MYKCFIFTDFWMILDTCHRGIWHMYIVTRIVSPQYFGNIIKVDALGMAKFLA
jgi:hypothetical protein